MLKLSRSLFLTLLLGLIAPVHETHAQRIKPKMPEDCDILFVAQRGKLFPQAKFKITQKCTIALYKFSVPDTIKEKYKNLDLGSFQLFQAKISNALIASTLFNVVTRKDDDMKEVITTEQNLWSNPTLLQTTAATQFGKMIGADLGLVFEIATLHLDHSLTRIRNAEFEEKIDGRLAMGFKTINLVTGKIVCENTIQTKTETKKALMFANSNIDYQQAFEDLLDRAAEQFASHFSTCTNHKDFIDTGKAISQTDKPLIDVLQIVINRQAGADSLYTAALKHDVDPTINQNDILDLIYKNSIAESTIGRCIIVSINKQTIQAKLTTVLEILAIENTTNAATPYSCRRIN